MQKKKTKITKKQKTDQNDIKRRIKRLFDSIYHKQMKIRASSAASVVYENRLFQTKVTISFLLHRARLCQEG